MKHASVRALVTSVFAAVLGVLPAMGAQAATSSPARAGQSAAARQAHLVEPGRSSAVCSATPAPGHARCDAVVRHDRLARALAPTPGASASPSGLLGDNGAYSPAYLRSAYNVASLGAGSNFGASRVVGVVDAYNNPNLLSDLNYYRTYFGMKPCVSGTVSSLNTTCVLQQVNQGGQASPLPTSNQSWGFETAMDVEMVSALCVNCQILVVEAQSSAMTDLGASVNTAVRLGATVVSNSYGSSEYSSEVTDAHTYYTHPGVPILAAAGDSGYGVQFPAAASSVIAVGGTTLLQSTANGTRSATESVWSGTGSGCSSYVAKPSWQTDPNCPRRSVNDVAAIANPNTGAWVYDLSSGPMMSIAGGTSLATAVVSALYALTSGSWSTAVTPAALLYAGTSSLYHVTTGANATCENYLCDATQSVNGYNGPTGVGTLGGSPSSAPAMAGASDLTQPSNLNVIAGNASIALTWGAPLAGASTPLGYDVYVGASGANLAKVNSALLTATSYQVTGLVNAQSYSVVVHAIYAGAPDAVSATVNVTPQFSLGQAAAPSAVIALPGNGAVTVGWTAPSVSGSSTITSYLATDGKGHSCAYVVDASLTNSCTITGLANGAVVTIRVAAINSFGQGQFSTPSGAVVPKATLSVRQLSVGNGYGCAIVAGGRVDCWGANASGQLGNGTFSTSSGLNVVAGLSGVVSIATGAASSCAVTSSGAAYCWGANASGQLGNGTTVTQANPTLVQGVSGATEVSVGTNYACARLASGQVSCWGDNAMGQLGNGGTSATLNPVMVLKVTNATYVAASLNHTCALLTGGAVSCWGANASGQLGNGTRVAQASPTLVQGISGATLLSLGASDTCVVLGDGSVWCWGYNGDGELGNSNLAASSTPVKVMGLPTVTQISSGAYGTCATDAAGVEWCWGNQAGSQDVANALVSASGPSALTKISGVTQFSEGYNNQYGCATLTTGALVCWSASGQGPSVVSAPLVKSVGMTHHRHAKGREKHKGVRR